MKSLKPVRYLAIGVTILLISACGSKGEDEDTIGLQSKIFAKKQHAGAIDQELNYELAAYLKSNDISNYDYLGRSVAIDGDVAVVSAASTTTYPDGSTDGSGTDGSDGKAFVYRKQANGTWDFEKALSNDTDESYGFSVAVAGDVIAVGSPATDSGSSAEGGAIYVYRYADGAWAVETTLTATTPADNEYLGFDVAISGDGTRIVGGAPGLTSAAGSAFVFAYASSTWSEEDELVDGDTTGEMGRSVDISDDGTLVIVGAYAENSNVGAAFIYRYASSSWSLEEEIAASESGGYFGWDVAISDDVAAVINFYYDDLYVFRYSGSAWVEEATAIEVDLVVSVDIDDNIIVVGCPYDDQGGLDKILTGTTQEDLGWDQTTDSGAARVFTYADSSWTQTAYIKAPNADVDDIFGSAVAVSDGQIFIGAPYEDGGSDVLIKNDNSIEYSGAGYIFSPARDLTTSQ